MYESFPKPTEADIVIIGAGISGMSAAFYILQYIPTVQIIILEARRQIGGRTQSFPLKIHKGEHLYSYDLGGQFVSSSQAHLLDLIQKLNINLVKSPESVGKTVLELGGRTIMHEVNDFNFLNSQEAKELSRFFEKIDSMCQNVTFTKPFPLKSYSSLDQETMESFTRRHIHSTAGYNFVRHAIKAFLGMELTQISLLFYLAQCNSTDGIINQFNKGGARESWIEDGADTICNKIAGILGRRNIKLDDPVIEIRQEAFHVGIETENQTYRSSYAIIAIPPSSVAEIDFYPPLPATPYDVLKSMQTGHLTKFVVTYSKQFWRDKGYTGEIISYGKESGSGPICSCFNITFKNKPALTGYISSSDCTTQPNNQTHKEEVLEQLAKYFGDEALHPTDYCEKSWTYESYIDGCYVNSPGIGNMDKFSEIRRPLKGIFWAGTETATTWNGYMGGAVQAGYRAAIEVLYDYRPQCLKASDIAFINFRERKSRSRFWDDVANTGSNWKLLVPVAGVLLALYLYRKLRTVND